MPSTITYLEMRSPDRIVPKSLANDRISIREATVKQWRFNQFLYAAVGAPWAWRDKLSWTEEQWREYAESPDLRTFAAYHDGSPAGYYELKWDDEPSVQIVYFGLLPAFYGQGLGGALLTHALRQAWSMSPARVWLHTCTEDHPAALANYLARGMTIYRVVEVA